MDIKKLILTVLMLFLLNFSAPIGGQLLNGREKNIIAFVITSDDDNNVANLLKDKDKYILSEIVSLHLKISMINSLNVFNNTS